MSKDYRINADMQISQLILNSLVFGWAEDILLYSASKGEADFPKVAQTALELGKRVYYPVSLENGIMEFHEVFSTGELAAGKFAIPEPSKASPVYEYDAKRPALCLVPSLCVDTSGYRIGYGKGYYDRFIKAYGEIVFCAVQYDEMVLEKVMFDKRYDKRVDMIVTEKGEYVIGQKE